MLLPSEAATARSYASVSSVYKIRRRRRRCRLAGLGTGSKRQQTLGLVYLFFQGGNRTRREQDGAKLINCVSLERLGANGPPFKAEVCTKDKLCSQHSSQRASSEAAWSPRPSLTASASSDSGKTI